MSTRPNIIWYCTDQQRFDTIGALGNPKVHTPRLDAFMGRAVTFDRAYCQSPICTPSRASFLTGMYPSAVGVNQNGNPNFPASQAERLVPRRLADAGYGCALVGKLHIASAEAGQEPRVADGYRVVHYSHDHKGPDKIGHDYAEWLRRQGSDPAELLPPPVTGETYRASSNHGTGRLRPPTQERDNVPPHLHQTAWCTAMAIDFIRSNRGVDQPWMVSINPFDPHPPFDPPWEYYRRFDPSAMPAAHVSPSDVALQQRLAEAGIDFQTRAPAVESDSETSEMIAAYYAMIEQMDHEFGRLLDFLEAEGQLDNTIIIFTSDHGEALGDHGLVLKGCRFYEGSVRVPLMIAGPGVTAPGHVRHELVELIDLAPTLYEAAGLPIPWWVQGRSLGPLIRGERPLWRRASRCEYYAALALDDQSHATMYRTDRYKLICYHGKGITELYDLQTDPWEHINLADDPASEGLRAELLEASLAATVFAHPPDPPRLGPY